MTLNPFKLYRQYKQKKYERYIKAGLAWCILEQGRITQNLISRQQEKSAEDKQKKATAIAENIIKTANAIIKLYTEPLKK